MLEGTGDSVPRVRTPGAYTERLAQCVFEVRAMHGGGCWDRCGCTDVLARPRRRKVRIRPVRQDDRARRATTAPSARALGWTIGGGTRWWTSSSSRWSRRPGCRGTRCAAFACSYRKRSFVNKSIVCCFWRFVEFSKNMGHCGIARNYICRPGFEVPEKNGWNTFR